MRSILIAIMFGALLFLPGVNFAETDPECKQGCDFDKEARDAGCQTGEETDDPQARTQCLIESQRAYNSCLAGCPQLAPPETSATPTEN